MAKNNENELMDCPYIKGKGSPTFDCMGLRVVMKDGDYQDFDPIETYHKKGYEGAKYIIETGHRYEFNKSEIEEILDYELHYTDEERYKRYFPSKGEWK